jgi:hypothetical protein
MAHVNGNKDYQTAKWKEIFLNRIKSYNPDDTRICVSCGKTKKLSEFYSGIIKTASGHDTMRTVKKCKECFRKDARDRHSLIMKESHIERREQYKKRFRYTSIKIVYGLEREEYERMLADQNNKCAICGTHMEKPYIDHCHKSGDVRGLLCMKCNMGLGHFKDDVSIMKNAISYIEKYSTGTVSKPVTPING